MAHASYISLPIFLLPFSLCILFSSLFAPLIASPLTACRCVIPQSSVTSSHSEGKYILHWIKFSLCGACSELRTVQERIAWWGAAGYVGTWTPLMVSGSQWANRSVQWWRCGARPWIKRLSESRSTNTAHLGVFISWKCSCLALTWSVGCAAGLSILVRAQLEE